MIVLKPAVVKCQMREIVNPIASLDKRGDCGRTQRQLRESDGSYLRMRRQLRQQLREALVIHDCLLYVHFGYLLICE